MMERKETNKKVIYIKTKHNNSVYVNTNLTKERGLWNNFHQNIWLYSCYEHLHMTIEEVQG